MDHPHLMTSSPGPSSTADPSTTRSGATYSNPILDADWPDPDAIRVGEDYWMVASSFNRAPGLPVLHSRDLVNWEHVTNALPAVPPAPHFAAPRHGQGVWAPSLRHHDGVFHIVHPDPDHGIFVTSATDPRGPWSTPHLLLEGRGLIDPCPVWHEDGSAHLVFGWARSRAGVKNRISLVEVDPQLRGPLDDARVIIDGDAIPDCTTLEGPKIYRRDGWHWIFAPAGGVATGWQYVFRSRNIAGPYEHRIVLEQHDSDINGPHQGAWVTTPQGEDWFLHFQDRGPFGRVVHLQPMRWGDDGWPRLGEPVDEISGRPVRRHTLPHPPSSTGAASGAPPQREPSRSDEFRSTVLAPRWHWQANPQPHWLHVRGDGTVDLAALPVSTEDLRQHGAVLGQQLPGRASRWTTRLHLTGAVPGAQAGLTVLGSSYAWIGLEQRPDGTWLICRTGDDAGENVVHEEPVSSAVELSMAHDDDARATFRWRHHPQDDWHDVSPSFTATKGRWIGSEVGLFARCVSGAQAGASMPSGPADGGTAPRDARGVFSAVTVCMDGRRV
ncbi:glycoside hydrolase 43 family protein [Nesterenkonia sp. HG001]|uniref:glycoside hydrolase family 43 protein n=1 Tax=Nesterenkonia sp. HG001 TaxID=2983207 RepID=UPI002AC7D257|nr:family 43 glycosylhydrolase [Nesterenkonia sp. HG001]MDZ5077238.1 glycoside hydrolase 43 family protein [Nesterenkonia sp. HG001]